MAKENINNVEEPTLRTRRRKRKDPILTETILGVLSVVSVMIAALLIFSMVHAGGTGGEVLFTGLQSLIGVFTYFTPLLFLYIAYYLWKEEVPDFGFLSSLGSFFLLIGIAGLGTIMFGQSFGGMLGVLAIAPLVKYFAIYPSFALLAGITFIGALIISNRKPSLSPILDAFIFIFKKIKNLFTSRKKISFDDEDMTQTDADLTQTDAEEIPMTIIDDFDDTANSSGLHDELFGKLLPEDITPLPKKEIKAKPIILTPDFVAPPLDLLNIDSGKSGAGDSKSKMTTIQRTLEHFRINVEMGEVTVGPTVTQFTLKPAQGVNLSKIVALHDNLAMELGSEFLRIEAPIPGKTLVGIEIPNERKALLGLR